MRKANEAIRKIRHHTMKGTMFALSLDLSSFKSIETFSDNIKKFHNKFDCLIENGGLALYENQVTLEEFEIHFGVNYLGHFFLTDLLKDNIRQNNCRIVIVSSKMHEKGLIDFNNFGKYFQYKGKHNQLYNNSKLMNFYFAGELYHQGFDSHVLCPGFCNTDLFRHYNPKWYHYVLFSPIAFWYLRSAKQGAQNIIHCATIAKNTPVKNPSNGFYVRDLKQCKSKHAFLDEVSKRLWKESIKLCRTVLSRKI